VRASGTRRSNGCSCGYSARRYAAPYAATPTSVPGYSPRPTRYLTDSPSRRSAATSACVRASFVRLSGVGRFTWLRSLGTMARVSYQKMRAETEAVGHGREADPYLFGLDEMQRDRLHRPSVRLRAAVLEVALSDLRHPSEILRRSARHWFESSERHPFSFLDVCDALGLDPDASRAAIGVA
jgi:hypothetical protein